MAWLLLFVPPLREAPINRYDVLERNVVVGEDSSEFCQWIVWDWDHERFRYNHHQSRRRESLPYLGRPADL